MSVIVKGRLRSGRTGRGLGCVCLIGADVGTESPMPLIPTVASVRINSSYPGILAKGPTFLPTLLQRKQIRPSLAPGVPSASEFRIAPNVRPTSRRPTINGKEFGNEGARLSHQKKRASQALSLACSNNAPRVLEDGHSTRRELESIAARIDSWNVGM